MENHSELSAWTHNLGSLRNCLSSPDDVYFLIVPTLSVPIYPCSSFLCSVWKYPEAFPVENIVHKVTFIALVVCPHKQTFSLFLASIELTCVFLIRQFKNSNSVIMVFIKCSFIIPSWGECQFSLTISFPVCHITFINISVWQSNFLNSILWRRNEIYYIWHESIQLLRNLSKAHQILILLWLLLWLVCLLRWKIFLRLVCQKL